MKNEPIVSIVLPVFNGDRYIEDSIKSCLAQIYTCFELIIVDDASTDTTPEIIKRYCDLDARITSVKHSVNRKLPASLNTGFSQAQGDLLTWTSDDNLYRPQALEKMVGFLQKNPQIDIVYSNYAQIDETDKMLGIHTVKPIEKLVFGNVVGACFLYKREVQERLAGYSENLFLAEDYDFWLRASNYYRFAALQEVLYDYRVHQQSLTSNREEQIYSSHEKALEKNLSEMFWTGKEMVMEGWIHLARKSYEKGKYRKMLKHLGHAFVVSPINCICRLLSSRF